MLSNFELERISEIVELAAGKAEEEQVEEYSLVSVVWDDNDNCWQCKFYSDYGTFEYTVVFIVESGADFEVSGYTHLTSPSDKKVGN